MRISLCCAAAETTAWVPRPDLQGDRAGRLRDVPGPWSDRPETGSRAGESPWTLTRSWSHTAPRPYRAVAASAVPRLSRRNPRDARDDRLHPACPGDSAKIQEADAEKHSRRLLRAGKKAIKPIYGPRMSRLPSLFVRCLRSAREVADGITVRLVDAGHILGSAQHRDDREREGRQRVIVFSGDIGLKGSPDRSRPNAAGRTPIWSFSSPTYGDRDHRSREQTLEEFREILTRAVKKGEKVLIPAFAIGRTQEILYRLAELIRDGRIPQLPIYLDSPMAIAATRLYVKHQDLFDDEAGMLMRRGSFLRDLTNLRFTESAAESQKLNDIAETAVIIAGSGMCDGGRIVHHLRHNLWRRNVAVLIVGFQAENSLGRRLVEGAKDVRIFGEKIVVRAAIYSLGGFSAHAGQAELIDWAAHLAPARPRIVLTHGEPRARDTLRDLLQSRFGIAPECPGPGETIVLE